MNTKEIANPAPLGLIGFGMTTILLNLHNSGIIEGLPTVIIAMGITIGGVSQVIAGILEFLKNNLFGATAFTCYGFFWLALVLVWTFPTSEGVDPTNEFALAWFLLLWGIFTLVMAIGTLKHNIASRVVFFSLTLLFFLLAAADFTLIHEIKVLAGYVGIFCGASALYNAFGQILNHEFKKTILPLG